MSIIRIKRSGSNGAPSTLSPGELAYSWYDDGGSNLTTGGLRLYVGAGVDANTGLALSVDPIGGTYFTTKLDHTPGTLVANSAIITAANNAIDQLLIDKVHIDGNSIGINSDTNYALANTDLDIVAGSAGTINLNSPVAFSSGVEFDDAVGIDGDLRVGTAGANNFVVTATSGNTYVKGTLDVDGQATLASANIEDLTDNRIVIAGTAGELEDDANFRFDGTNFQIGASGSEVFDVDVATGNTDILGTLSVGVDATFGATDQLAFASANSTLTLTGNADITGQLDVDELQLNGNTLASTDTDGDIYLNPNGDGYVQAVGTNAFVIPVGNTAQSSTANVQGAIRYNSEITQFEGYSGSNWSSLGGVRSVDGLTYIIAESAPSVSDDILYFYGAANNTTTDTSAKLAEMDFVSLRLFQDTASANTTTGSLVVTGGAGISGDINVGGDVDIAGDLNVEGADLTTTQTTFNLLNTGATTVNAFGAATAVNIGTGGEGGGKTTIAHDVDVTGDFEVGTAAFTVDAATGDTLVGNDLTVTGDLVVNGSQTTINVDTLQVEDALIYLAANNTSADSVDIGFAGNYNDGTDNHLAGLIRDAGTKEWYLFDVYDDADISDNNIDISDSTFSRGVLNVDEVDFSNTTIQLTGDVAGTVTFDHLGGGDGASNTVITIATTVQADSVQLGNDTDGNYVTQVTDGASVTGTASGSVLTDAIHVTGTGEGAAVVVSAVIADNAGQLGVATFDALAIAGDTPKNFAVSAAGSVSIDTVDGGTY